MKLYIKQHFLTLFGCDSFDVFDENGDTVYTVQGEFSIGKCLNIYDASEQFLGTVKRRLLTWLPQFEIYLGEEYLGVIQKEFSLFTPSFSISAALIEAVTMTHSLDFKLFASAYLQGTPQN